MTRKWLLGCQILGSARYCVGLGCAKLSFSGKILSNFHNKILFPDMLLSVWRRLDLHGFRNNVGAFLTFNDSNDI